MMKQSFKLFYVRIFYTKWMVIFTISDKDNENNFLLRLILKGTSF